MFFFVPGCHSRRYPTLFPAAASSAVRRKRNKDMSAARSNTDIIDERSARTNEVEFIPLKQAMAGIRLKGDGGKAGQLYEILRRMVVELVLLPNQILSEKEVALCLNVSKTPVREAFIRLAEDRVVHIVPHSGTYVAPIDVDLAMEGYIIWSALGSSCAARAAETRSLDGAELLRNHLVGIRKYMEAQEPGAFRRAVQGLHNAIFELAGIPDARKLIDATRFEIDRLKTLAKNRYAQTLEQTFAELSAIVNAISTHAAEEAHSLMVEHLRRTGDIVARFGSGGEQEERVQLLNRQKPDSRRPRRQLKRRRKTAVLKKRDLKTGKETS